MAERVPFPNVNPIQPQTLSRLSKQDVTAKVIDQSDVAQYVIFNGLAINRPDGTTEVRVYFANDTGVLSIWNGVSWVSVTLT